MLNCQFSTINFPQFSCFQMSTEISCTPPEIRQTAQNAAVNLLPVKSQDKYEKQYRHFEKWCAEHQIHSISENVLLAYFDGLREKYKPTSVWSIYSMVRVCLNIHKNVDISQYKKLQALLKRFSQGYRAKKSKILEETDIKRFISEANDKKYLAMKVILIMGYNGACRREELINMCLNDVELKSDSVFVTVPKTKNYVPRMFAITDKNWVELIKKYMSLRPKNVIHNRFFLTYRKGYCINSPIGINTMGNVPKEIATFLKLPDPHLFTGHCFRRSSATHIANSGGDLLTIKRLGGWKSSAVAEGYVDSSLSNKIHVSKMFAQEPGCSTMPDAELVELRGTKTIENNPVAARQSHITVTGNNTHEQNVSSTHAHGITVYSSDTSTVNISVYNNCTFDKNN